MDFKMKKAACFNLLCLQPMWYHESRRVVRLHQPELYQRQRRRDYRRGRTGRLHRHVAAVPGPRLQAGRHGVHFRHQGPCRTLHPLPLHGRHRRQVRFNVKCVMKMHLLEIRLIGGGSALPSV